MNYVSPGVMGFPPEVNDWVAGYCKDRPRLIPMGSVHPRASVDVAAEAERLVALGIRMFKVHPAHQLLYPNDEGYRSLYEVASRHRIPVTIHSGTSIFPNARNKYTDPIHIDDIAVECARAAAAAAAHSTSRERHGPSRAFATRSTSPTSRSSSPTRADRSGT